MSTNKSFGQKLPILVCIAIFGTPAFAQTAAPDGSQRETSRAVRAETERFTCGPLEYSMLVTNTRERTTKSTSFVQLPQASIDITIPPGASRCVKVVFSAEAACSPTDSGDFCYVRALDNEVALHPRGGNFNAFVSEDGTAESQSFEWVRLVQPGNHTFTIEWRVRDTPTSFFLDEYTFDVQVYDSTLGDGD